MSDVKQWMPLYIGAYLRNTQRLTTEQHGAYILLMMEYWNAQAPLPDDDDELSLITRLPRERWLEMRGKLSRFFTVENGLWRHERIDAEIEKAEQKMREKSERMAKARAAKAAKSSDKAPIIEPVIGPLTELPSPSPSPSPLPSPKYEEPRTARARLGDEFWEKYPHPPNRGDKHGVIKKINALPDEEQQRALGSLTLFRKIIEDQRKKIPDYQPPMAATFVNQRRWESIMETPANASVPTFAAKHDDPECASYWEAMRSKIGDVGLRAWFQTDGQPCLRKNCAGFVIEATPMRADRIMQEFGPRLNDIFGKKNWRIEEPSARNKEV